MIKMERLTKYASPVHEYLERWIQARGTTWNWLVRRAGVAAGSSTKIRQGSIPGPGTLVSLAKAMDLAPSSLLMLAGYLTEEDIKEPPRCLLPEEEALLAIYRLLDDRGKSSVRAVGQAMLRSSQDQEEQVYHTSAQPGKHQVTVWVLY